MCNVYFHNMTDRENDEITLDRIPVIGETISFAVDGPIFLIKGITFNHFKDAEFEFDIYAAKINQTEWLTSIRE